MSMEHPENPVGVDLAIGRRVQFNIAPCHDADACFVLSVRKCGSTITNNMLTALAHSNGWCFVDVDATMFGLNIKTNEHQRDTAMQAILRRGVVYGGFRAMPLSFLGSPVFADGRKLLVIRDPRDALVSEYFSNAYSHPIPKATGGHDSVTVQMQRQRDMALQEGLDSSVAKRASMLGGSMLQYAMLLRDPKTLVVKYEDFIFRKRAFLHEVAAHFGWVAHPGVVDAILSWADVRPDTEDPHRFVRQVSPGDHARKLKPETISVLNERLSSALLTFGYAM